MHSLQTIRKANTTATWFIYAEGNYWVARHKYLLKTSPRCASRAEAEQWALDN